MGTNDYETILLERGRPDGVVIITFNRPEVRNALDRAMVNDVRHALNALYDDPDCRALVFTGAGGKAFISGADIAQLKERTREQALQRINSALFHEIEQFPRPTIAAVRGYALGGGCELAIACDLRVAGESAVLGQPEVGLGIIPAAGGCYRLPRLIGLGRAKQLVFTGRLVNAPEALEIGLVETVVSDELVMDEAVQLAQQIAGNSALAVRMAKVLLNGQNEMSTAVGVALESASQAVLFEDEEKHARMGAFLDKRAARRAARAEKE